MFTNLFVLKWTLPVCKQRKLDENNATTFPLYETAEKKPREKIWSLKRWIQVKDKRSLVNLAHASEG